MTASPKLRTCLWYDKEGEEAARLYVSILPGSTIESRFAPDESGPPLTVEFSLAGVPYMALNGGPMFKHSPAASISVSTKDQAETDRLWNALVANGGAESMCGWLTDRFGVSWQIVPEALMRMLQDKDKAAAGRARDAMLKMRRIDIAALERAFAGR